MDTLKIKEWTAVGFSWALERDRQHGYFWLLRNGQVVDEGTDSRRLLDRGWFYDGEN